MEGILPVPSIYSIQASGEPAAGDTLTPVGTVTAGPFAVWFCLLATDKSNYNMASGGVLLVFTRSMSKENWLVWRSGNGSMRHAWRERQKQPLQLKGRAD